MEHFPLPWRHENGLVKAVSHGKWFTVVRGGSKFTPDGVEANAAFIVRACNSHYELVAALEALMPERIGYGQSMSVDMYLNAVAKARATLAKAKGE